jgi:hypothetical protein
MCKQDQKEADAADRNNSSLRPKAWKLADDEWEQIVKVCSHFAFRPEIFAKNI